MSRRLWYAWAVGVVTAGCACGGSPTEGQVGFTRAAIIDGTPATEYPEAALVDLLNNGEQFASCSGAVIAPQVVLTAGHCIAGATDWNVTTPYVTGQTVHGSAGAVFDYRPPSSASSSGEESVDPDLHDIGLVFLDQPVELVSYPVVADAPVATGTLARNIGRVDDGVLSTTDLFYGQTVQLFDASTYGYPFDYAAEDVIESGDSGGPVEMTTAHVIVAVNSGGDGQAGGDGATGGDGVEVLGRVDLVSQWIQAQIAANGGGGADAGAFNADYAATQDPTDAAGGASAGESGGSSAASTGGPGTAALSCAAAATGSGPRAPDLPAVASLVLLAWVLRRRGALARYRRGLQVSARRAARGALPASNAS